MLNPHFFIIYKCLPFCLDPAQIIVTFRCINDVLCLLLLTSMTQGHVSNTRERFAWASDQWITLATLLTDSLPRSPCRWSSLFMGPGQRVICDPNFLKIRHKPDSSVLLGGILLDQRGMKYGRHCHGAPDWGAMQSLLVSNCGGFGTETEAVEHSSTEYFNVSTRIPRSCY